MATLYFSVEVEDEEEATLAFTSYLRWEPFLPDTDGILTIPNPITREEFAQQAVIDFVNNSINSYYTNRDIELIKQASVSRKASMEALNVIK